MTKTQPIEIIDSNPSSTYTVTSIANPIYVLRYKKGNGAVREIHFSSKDDEEAKKRSLKFCSKNGFRHIYTKSFLTDLETYKNI